MIFSRSSKYLGGGRRRTLGDPLLIRSNLAMYTLTKGFVLPGLGYLSGVGMGY